MALEMGAPLNLTAPLIIRFHALFALTSEYSIVIDRRPSARATVFVVPDPQNGSSTSDPSLLHARITRSRYTSGI